ncbi:MAG: YbaN family protein [Hyphomicrobiales bacterium]
MGTFPADRASSKWLVRVLLRVAGAVLVGIGVLGIFLPLLPTTVFLLGAAACFGKSSPGAYRWLTTNPVFGRYLREYREERGATIGTKVVSLLSLWVGIGIAAWVFRDMLWLDALLGAIAIGVTIHLLSLRTLR